jgi:hypothetical protein
VANAAATAFKPLLELKLHQIDKTFAISVRHFLLMVQLAFPLLAAAAGPHRRDQRGGHGRLHPRPRAARGGEVLDGDARALPRLRARAAGGHRRRGAARLHRHGVDPLMAGPFHAKLQAAEVVTHPLRTAATPDDAAEAVALVCLPEARWLNGQVIQNDGGGLFAYLGRFGQAWAMVPDEAVMPDVTGAPLLGGDVSQPLGESARRRSGGVSARVSRQARPVSRPLGRAWRAAARSASRWPITISARWARVTAV